MSTVLISPAERELATQLEKGGAKVLFWPELSICELKDCSPLDEAIQNLFGYDWLILKNHHAADFFLRRLKALNRESHELDDLHVVALGEATAGELINSHVHVDLSLPPFSQSSVVTAIESYLGSRELLARLNCLAPSAMVTEESFETALADAGARVDRVPAYRTTSNNRGLSELKALSAGGAIDSIVFPSSHSVEEFAALCDTEDLLRLWAAVPVVCADESTLATAGKFGLTHAVSPPEPTAESLHKLIVSA